jgi:hypothetical protein
MTCLQSGEIFRVEITGREHMENNGGAHSKGEFTWDPISIAMPL